MLISEVLQDTSISEVLATVNGLPANTPSKVGHVSRGYMSRGYILRDNVSANILIMNGEKDCSHTEL